MNTTLLDTRYDSRASFYGKARVTTVKHGDNVCPVYNDTVLPNEDGNCSLCDIPFDSEVSVLTSYSTNVAYLTTDLCPNKCAVRDTYSATTLRHIKEFLRQNGFKAENSKQIMADYGV